MNYYKIVRDEELMKSFISSLPDLKPHEVYYVSLISRKKYSTADYKVSDKIGIKAFTTTKDRMFDKIKQLECAVGLYKDYKYGVDIAENTIGLYMHLNPRNLKLANAEFASETVKNSFKDDENLKRRNPVVWSKTYVSRSKSKTKYLGFDFDMKDDWTKDEWLAMALPILNDIINKEAYFIIETRGGFHVIMEIDKVAPEYKKSWHLNLVRRLSDIDVTGDMMSPIPGGIQGGFIPTIVKR